MNQLWVLGSAFLVFTMQAGFLCLETGLVRSKNSINVAAKNISDFILSSAVFWLVGYGLMFGSSVGGWFGSNHFLFSGTQSSETLVFFIFQMMFCGTAATLVSGAVAERTAYLGYIVITLVITLCIYPIIGHWAWGGLNSAVAQGWLEKLGFIDFAGSTVVHSVGGWVALAALLIIGPRIGRYDISGTRIPGSNFPMAILGCLLIWLGWFGFNGGSTLAWDDTVPSILLNTLIAAVWGGVIAACLKYAYHRYIDVMMVANGVLGGLVSITANCHLVTADQAMLIGLTGGVIVFYGDRLMDRLQIDDAISVVPVHLFAGIWGTLAVAIFGRGIDTWTQLPIQALGIITIGIYSFGLSYVLFKWINRYLPLRISHNDELIGLNVAEHKVSTEVYDLLSTMQHQQQAADFSMRVPEEPFTEVGQIAQQYNRVIDKVNQEILQRDQAFNAYKRSEYRKGAILDAAMDCIISMNYRGNIIEFNPSAEQCFGMAKKRVVGINFFDLFVPETTRQDALNCLDSGFVSTGKLILKRQNMMELLRSDGKLFSAEIVITPTNDNGNKQEYTFYIRDVTQHLKLQNRLKELAYHDPLTHLFNRTYFLNSLKQRIIYHRSKGGHVAMMFLDLDKFKKINDNLGHKAGDELLCEVADRLTKITRDVDLVGRWGGDEFVIAMSGDITTDLAEAKAKAILSAMCEPVELAGQFHVVPTSIGIAVSENGQYDAEKLLQYADIAMYQAKEAGRNTYRVFDDIMSQQTSHEFHLERAIPKAIRDDEFALYYQPKVNCHTGKVVGYESLIRWHHPKDGLIPPNEFIPVIDGSDLIIQLGEWVIESVTKQLAEWRELGMTLVPIAVNISGHHLHSSTLPAFVSAMTDKYKIPGHLLEIEITEGVLTGNTEESIAAMRAVKETNIRLSVDDFGTGYSSLSYLKKFPVDVLKIDRAFIRECDTNREDAAICMAIITLAKSLGLEIIAEGVETQSQLDFLRQHQCEIYQGYLFSKPLPADEIFIMQTDDALIH